MYPQIQPQASYGHGGSWIFKRTSNYIFYQVEELIQGDLGYFVQEFGSFPTQISRFFGLGEPYRQTVPATDSLWLWGFLHIEEDVKLHILSGGGINPGGSWVFGAGVWIFPTEISKILAGKPTLGTNGSSHSAGMAMGVGAYQRARQTTYSIRGVDHSVHNWDSWCRGLDISHRNFEIFGRGECTAPCTGMLWTWGMVQIEENVKLHILLGDRIFLRGSDQVGAGVC
jgi:hypothetical protein